MLKRQLKGKLEEVSNNPRVRRDQGRLSFVPKLPKPLNQLQIIATNISLQRITQKSATTIVVFYRPAWIRLFADIPFTSLPGFKKQVNEIEETGQYIQCQTMYALDKENLLHTYIKNEHEKGFLLPTEFAYRITPSACVNFDAQRYPDQEFADEDKSQERKKDHSLAEQSQQQDKKKEEVKETVQVNPQEPVIMKKICLQRTESIEPQNVREEGLYKVQLDLLSLLETAIQKHSDVLKKYPNLDARGYTQSIREYLRRSVTNSTQKIAQQYVTVFISSLSYLIRLLELRAQQTTVLDQKLTRRSFGTYLFTVSQTKQGLALIQPGASVDERCINIEYIAKTVLQIYGDGILHQVGAALVLEDYGEEQKKHYHMTISFPIKEQTSFRTQLLNQLRVALLSKRQLNYSAKDIATLDAFFDVQLPQDDRTNDTIHWVYLLDKLVVAIDEMTNGIDYSTRELPMFITNKNLDHLHDEAKRRMARQRTANQKVQVESQVRSIAKDENESELDQLFNAGREKHSAAFQNEKIIPVMSSLEYQGRYRSKVTANPLTNEQLITDLVSGRTAIASLPVPVQIKYGQTLKEVDCFIQDQYPQCFRTYLQVKKFDDPVVYDALAKDEKLAAYADSFRTFIAANPGFARWCQNVCVAPKHQAFASEEGTPLRTVLFLHGQTGIGKTSFAHQILLGGEQGMKFLQVPMNPRAFVGSTTVSQASANAYHLFLNDEASFDDSAKFPYADLKRMWEGGQYFNVKHGSLVSKYSFRMPFLYITNQTVSDMYTAVSIAMQDNQQIIDSFFNRIIQIDLAKPKNKFLFKKFEPDVSVLDLHALFWCILVQEFKILDNSVIQKMPNQDTCAQSKYLSIIEQLQETKQQTESIIDQSRVENVDLMCLEKPISSQVPSKDLSEFDDIFDLIE